MSFNAASNPFEALRNPSAQQPQQQRGRSNARSAGGGVAAGALKRAGLIDEDAGMRDASSAGPSRRGGGGDAKGKGRARGAANAPMRIDDDASRTKTSRARDRANPMAGGRPKRGAGTGDARVTGQAYGIRGAAAQNGQGKGRIPGGGGGGGGQGGAGTSAAATLSAARGISGATTNINSGQIGTGKTIALLRRFLQARWDAGAKFLNLDAMASDPVLQEEGLRPPGAPGAHKDIGSVVWKLCKEMFGDVTTLSLARNDFKGLAPVSTLPEFLPDLKNLSLEGNDIKWTRDLVFLSSKPAQRGPSHLKFKQLNELILNGNPVRDSAVAAGNEANYRGEVLVKFPTLTLLDRQAVSPEERQFAQLPKSEQEKAATVRGAAAAGVELRDFPIQVKGGFADDEAGRIVPEFLSKFFSMYDEDRAKLRPVYGPSAGFTCVQMHNVPPRARSAGYINTLPRQKDLSWKAYSAVPSHNMLSLGTRSATKGFPHGPGAILAVISKMPKSKHPLTDASKFVVDAWVTSNKDAGAILVPANPPATMEPQRPDALLLITVHGEFAEAPSYGVRSFSRTFIVAPAPPDSAAAKAGWSCVILSDQLTIRQYAASKAWVPDSLPMGSGANVTATPSAAAPVPAANGTPSVGASGLTPQQESLAAELSARSKLTLPFAVQCLSENAWDPARAWANFEALRNAGSIPAEAFLPA